MDNEDSGPDTDRYKYTSDDRRNDANNHNGMLLGREIGIDDHCDGRNSLLELFQKEKENMRDPGPGHGHI